MSTAFNDSKTAKAATSRNVVRVIGSGFLNGFESFHEKQKKFIVEGKCHEVGEGSIDTDRCNKSSDGWYAMRVQGLIRELENREG